MERALSCAGACLLLLTAAGGEERTSRVTDPAIETSFELPGLTGSPFDPAANDVRVELRGPTGKRVSLPAFFDGGRTWRVRHTPAAAGEYSLARVTRNGAAVRPEGAAPRSFTIRGPRGRGFVRRDAKRAGRFAFDDGTPYYPLGHNAGWRPAQGPDIPGLLAKMGAAGENWSRVWMNHWDGKNLDWPAPGALGELSLQAARRWDTMVAAAERAGIRIQIVLQHHGQYSTRVNPNWDENPWNRKNGGFLAAPEEFFTSERARALTKAKYRYIAARWGHSPAVMAWELFNEVQFTDAIRLGRAAEVAAWHREMAAHLRAEDAHRHLVTTSSDPGIPGLFDAMDFVQLHAYPPDPVSPAAAADPARWGGRPVFYGEIGPQGDLSRDGGFLRASLWASLMGPASGAAQYWAWDTVDRLDLYGEYRSASAFLKESGLAAWRDARPFAPEVETADMGAVELGPGGGWGRAKRTEFTVPPSGAVEGLAEMPAYLQGEAHRALFPRADFRVNFARPGTCAVTLSGAARAGARLVLRVDGAVAAEREFPPAAEDGKERLTLRAAVPAGAHVLRLENTGRDWVVLERIRLDPYGPAYRAAGKKGADRAALWLYRAAGVPDETGSPGAVSIPGLVPGRYRVTWWDTAAGRKTADAAAAVRDGRPLALAIPAGMKDGAVYVLRSGAL